MKKLIAILCMLTMLLSIVCPAVSAEENDLQAAIDAGAEEIIVLEADASNITVNRDTIIDLNGHNIDGVTVLAGTLYLMDSQTADYTVADGIYGHVTNVEGNLKAADGYLQVGDSFHAVNLDIYAMTLRAAEVGVYYKSRFAADEIVAAKVESFGVALSVVTAPNATNLETYCGYSQFTGFEAGEGANSATGSTLLKNIMKPTNGDAKNGKNAAMPVYGRAYIKTADGYFFGETVKRSLQEQVEAIDTVWDDLKASQKAPLLAMLDTFGAAMEKWSIPNISGIRTPGIDTEIEMPIDVTAENGIVTETVTVSEEGVEITVPMGAKLAEGTQTLTLAVTPKDASDSNLELEENYRLIPMDIHVEGLAVSETVPVIITLKSGLPAGLNDGNVQLYHLENGKTVAMTLVANPVNHNEFSYDPITGDVTLAMASFSEVVAAADTDNMWDGNVADNFAGGTGTVDDPYQIATAQQLAYFGKLVDEGKTFEGEFVELKASISLRGKNFDPIGYGYESDKYMTDGRTFNGTFNGNDHTISFLTQNGWEMGSRYSYSMAGAGLFASVVEATIMNVNITNADIRMECVDMGILVGYSQGNCTYQNIGIYDSKIANYQRATGGVVGEVSPRRNADGSLMFDSNTHTFENIHVGPDVVAGSLWGDFDAPVGGILGARWDDDDSTKVIMTDVTVACRLDVYNDITAAYRWHAYRRAGMLIGNTDTPPADGRTAQMATADFLTCKNVKVYLGDWVNYHYCEFNNTNNPGRNYPWVRVEEGENCDAYSNPRYGHPVDVNGNPVTNLAHTHQEGDTCGLLIPFGQLYGGGQGVYGAPATSSIYDGVTVYDKVVYTITYLIEGEVDEIIYVTDNSQPYTLKPAADYGERMQWLDREGNAITQIPAGNTQSKVVYLDDKEKLIAYFVDINGIGVGQVEFTKDTTKLEEPPVPYIEGYIGHWEKYDLSAGVSIVVKPVYTIDEAYTELFENMDLKKLFEYISQGKTVVMSQELSGSQGNASKDTCCVVTDDTISGFVDKNARLNLNGYQLTYEFNSAANKAWKIFDIRSDSSLTITGGIAQGGTLIMDLGNKMNDNARPVLFNLAPGGKLILEKGTIIELRFVPGAGDQVSMFGMNGSQFTLNQTDYPYLKYTHDAQSGVKRLVVEETTTIIGQ